MTKCVKNDTLCIKNKLLIIFQLNDEPGVSKSIKSTWCVKNDTKSVRIALKITHQYGSVVFLLDIEIIEMSIFGLEDCGVKCYNCK